MPILKREIEVFPDDLFVLPEIDVPWWVAHVRSRQEKALARDLVRQGIPFFLPCRSHRVRRAGRTFVSYVPLFPGYLFFRSSPARKHVAMESKLTVQVLAVQEQTLLGKELQQIYRLLESGADLVPYSDLMPGDPVYIQEGPFQGYTGVVVRTKGRLRLLVSISMLKQTVAVEFARQAVTAVISRSGNRQKDCTTQSPIRQKNHRAAVS